MGCMQVAVTERRGERAEPSLQLPAQKLRQGDEKGNMEKEVEGMNHGNEVMMRNWNDT